MKPVTMECCGEPADLDEAHCEAHIAAEDLLKALKTLRKKLIDFEGWMPDCIGLLAANEAIAKAEGRVFDSKQLEQEVAEWLKANGTYDLGDQT